jgi:acyl-CoA dehydrogenase
MDRAVEGMDRSFGAWTMPDEYREMQRLVRRFVQGDVRAVEDTLPA